MKRIKKLALIIYIIAVLIASVLLMIDFIRFPEFYDSVARHHLQLEIEKGDADAIKYYQENYIANGRELFPVEIN